MARPGAVNEEDAIEAFTRLGLSTYEARVFVALHRLGTGTASDIADVTDVPRSQVYGTADELESTGLVEVQQSTPRRYRPVSLSAARDHLRERFEADRDLAFDYLDAVQGELRESDDAHEAVWTVSESDAITDRIVAVVEDATDTVLFASGDREFVPESIREALAAAADRGVSVDVVSADPDVLDAFADVPGVDVNDITQPIEPEPPASRVVLVDSDTVVLGVYDGATESAIWSANSRFASVIAESMGAWFESGLQ